MIKFYESDIHEKFMKQGIQLNKKSNDLDLRSGRNPSLKIRKKNLHSNFGEKMKILISKIKLPI